MTEGWHRLLLPLAAAGAAISAYLALFEIGAIVTVWDPVFGAGSERVLHAAVARALPVPDALLGVVGYGLEIALLVALAVASPSVRARLTVLLGILAAAMALASVGLVLLQAVVVEAWCLLCLASAAISWAIALLAVPHAVRVLRDRDRDRGEPGRRRPAAAPRPANR